MSFAVILLLAVVCLVQALSFVPLVWAEDAAVPVTPALQPIYDVFKAIGYSMPIAVIMGLFTCLLGYLKQTPPEQFTLAKFIYTALISLIIGIATIYGGWTYAQVQEWLANGALTLYIYWIAKVIAKKLSWIIPVGKEAEPPRTA